MIEAEGAGVVDGHVDLAACGFADFTSDRPLEALARRQRELLDRLSLAPRTNWPETAGGVDVSYAGSDGVAAYALVEVATGEMLWSTTIRRPVSFPYITGFLAFRELPLHLALLEEVRAANRLADVLLVDGSGILHARRAGIATHLGIVSELETIGVTKKLLCGKIDTGAGWPAGGVEAPGSLKPAIRACDPVIHEGSVIGAAMLSTPKSARPIYVSPGSGIDVRSSVEIARALLRGRRLPEPLYWADRLSRAAARS
jgi:deoxyribonuclease V